MGRVSVIHTENNLPEPLQPAKKQFLKQRKRQRNLHYGQNEAASGTYHKARVPCIVDLVS